MSLLDLVVIAVVLLVSFLVPLPYGVVPWIIGALIVERILKGEKI